MLTRISRIYLISINYISTSVQSVRASIYNVLMCSVTITSMKMMIKVQVVIQSLAQKAVCVSSVRPFIINFRETLL